MMTRTKTICLFVVTAVLSTSVSAQTFYKVYNKYIDAYRGAAMETMQNFNVPASILLAQGMLESVGGTSPVAVEANNHFGIKCYDTDSGTYQYKADEFATEPTCFQQYASVAESFDDQARIFKLNPRYKILLQYTPDNYRAWARGLQHVGYATSPEYADHLIKLINHYKLYKYDQQVLKQRNSSSRETLAKQAKQAKEEAKAQKKAREEAEKAQKHADRRQVSENTAGAIATMKSEQPIVVNQSFNVGETHLVREYDVDRVNGVKFIVAQEGDTYFGIARKFDIDPKELRQFNDVPADTDIALYKGNLIYLQTKRPVAARGYDYHQVQTGESMYSIAQMYAIKMANLYSMNRMKPNDQLTVGQILRLR